MSMGWGGGREERDRHVRFLFVVVKTVCNFPMSVSFVCCVCNATPQEWGILLYGLYRYICMRSSVLKQGIIGVLCFAYRPLSQRQILFVSQCVSVSECPFEDEMTRDISPRIGR